MSLRGRLTFGAIALAAVLIPWWLLRGEPGSGGDEAQTAEPRTPSVASPPPGGLSDAVFEPPVGRGALRAPTGEGGLVGNIDPLTLHITPPPGFQGGRVAVGQGDAIVTALVQDFGDAHPDLSGSQHEDFRHPVLPVGNSP